MNIRALQFESRFSLPPNSLGYCGESTAPAKFKNCIINKKCEGVEEEIEKFIVLHPYLKALNEITNLDIYSHDLFEGYWLGNDILRQVKNSDYEILMKCFLEQGVPDFFVDELRSKKPKAFIPTHLFQVLHVGVGKASGSVPFNIDTINNCMIRWGKVKKIKTKTIEVGLNSLKIVSNKYKLTTLSQEVKYSPEIVPNLKKDDIVVCHWDMVVKKLNSEELRKLEFWTKKVIDSF